MEPFIVKHYTSDERPIIKGNGFDGLEIGEDREEAEAFIRFVNEIIDENEETDLVFFSDDEIIEEMDMRGYDCVKQKTCAVSLKDLYELKRTGKTAEFDKLFYDYCWQEIGRII